MLKKLRPSPSLLLEAVFMVVVWLGAWLIFDSLTIVLIAIFGAYAVVAAYLTWFESDAREERAERAERRRVKHETEKKASAAERAPAQAPAAQPILERLVAELEERRVVKEELPREVLGEEDLPLEVIAARAAPPAERPLPPKAPQPPAPAAPSKSPEPEPEPEPEPTEPEPTEPEPTAPPVPATPAPALPEEPVLLEELKPDEPVPAYGGGGWNLWQLERLMRERGGSDDMRDYERSLLLVYLRDYADSDGQLPAQFDALVQESFGELVRGRALP